MDKINTHMGVRKLPLIEKSVLSQSREACKVDSQLPRYLSVDSGSRLLRQSQYTNPLYRRRSLAETNLRPYFKRQNTFREDVGHAASETYLITSLSFKLLRYLGVGYRWLLKLAALFFYAWFLMPGFIQVGWYYFFSHHVHRSFVYGCEPRNRMDLYLPDGMGEELKPVLIFVTGGAWIIGYKAWGSLLGKLFVERGVIVVCLDYRNFPQGTISDMVKDVSQGVSYVFSNIAHFGGDPSRVFLAGQSAGAHIAACVLVEQARKELIEKASDLGWKASQLKAFFGISGGYDLVKLVDHFHKRGLYRSIFHSIMDGEDSLSHFSPERVVKSLNSTDAASSLPPIYLYHGMADCSIPCDASTSFAETLKALGVQAQTKLYPKKTHTDLFLQDPLRGGRDELVVDILAVVHDGDEDAQASDASAPPQKRLVPEIFLQLARAVSPF